MKNRQRGFGLVGVLVLLVAATLVVGVGWYMLGKNSSSSTKQPGASSTKSTVPNGWKTYCNTKDKECFDYPPAWTVSYQGSGDYHTVGITSDTVYVSGFYGRPYADSQEHSVSSNKVVSVTPLTGNYKDLTILGLYNETHKTSMYALVDDSFVTSNNLVTGQTYNIDEELGRSKLSFWILGTTKEGSTTDISWFDSQTAKDAFQALKSIRAQ